MLTELLENYNYANYVYNCLQKGKTNKQNAHDVHMIVMHNAHTLSTESGKL